MGSPVLDSMELEKQRGVERFSGFRFLGQVRKAVEVFVVLGFVSWSSARILAALRSAATAFFTVDYVFDHLVFFLIENAIIVALLCLGRRHAARDATEGGDFYYDEYSRHRAQIEFEKKEETEKEKQIVVYKSPDVEKETPQLEEVDEVIRQAVKRVDKFRRTESTNLKREIRSSPEKELLRSRTDVVRQRPRKGLDAVEMERLSSQEFRQLIEEFLEEHRRRRAVATDEKADAGMYQLMAAQ